MAEREWIYRNRRSPFRNASIKSIEAKKHKRSRSRSRSRSHRSAETATTTTTTKWFVIEFIRIDSMLLRSLKGHYLEASKMTPPPRVSLPEPFSIVNNNGPVLRHTYGKEEINVSVMRLANMVPDCGDDGFNQLFVHVDISKPGQKEGMHFVCGLYPDALGIHSVSLQPKPEKSSGFLMIPSKYNGPAFGDLDEKMREALHDYVNE